MGDYYKKNKVMEKEETKETLYEDFDELLIAWGTLQHKYQQTINQSYDPILPARSYLFGADLKSGKIGELRKHMDSLRGIRRMDMGKMVDQILEKIEDLDGWNDKYNDYLEQFTDEFTVMIKSLIKLHEGSLNQIDSMKDEIDRLREEKREEPIPDNRFRKEDLKEMRREGPMEKGREEDPFEPIRQIEIDNLRARFKSVYEQFTRNPIPSRKIMVWNLAGKNIVRLRLLEGWFEDAEKLREMDSIRRKYLEEKKIWQPEPAQTNPPQVSSPKPALNDEKVT